MSVIINKYNNVKHDELLNYCLLRSSEVHIDIKWAVYSGPSRFWSVLGPCIIDPFPGPPVRWTHSARQDHSTVKRIAKLNSLFSECSCQNIFSSLWRARVAVSRRILYIASFNDLRQLENNITWLSPSNCVDYISLDQILLMWMHVVKLIVDTWGSIKLFNVPGDRVLILVIHRVYLFIPPWISACFWTDIVYAELWMSLTD